jgi:mitochondrial chaperone BCS1
MENELPYRRSYLLCGPPGNGKTLAIRTVAEYLDTEPEFFDFSRDFEDESPDSAFLRWIKGQRMLIDEEETPPPVNKPIVRFLVLEDLDRNFPMEGSGKTRVSLSAVLNGLDGVIEASNVVMVATANDPSKLDKSVLIRPGRFHRRIFFDYPQGEEALDFLKWKFRKTTVSAETLKEVAEKTASHSFAFLADLLPSAAAVAFESRRKAIEDQDLQGAVDQQLDCLVKNEGRSKTGF